MASQHYTFEVLAFPPAVERIGEAHRGTYDGLESSGTFSGLNLKSTTFAWPDSPALEEID
jgi:hypothetical protein